MAADAGDSGATAARVQRRTRRPLNSGYDGSTLRTFTNTTRIPTGRRTLGRPFFWKMQLWPGAGVGRSISGLQRLADDQRLDTGVAEGHWSKMGEPGEPPPWLGSHHLHN